GVGTFHAAGVHVGLETVDELAGLEVPAAEDAADDAVGIDVVGSADTVDTNIAAEAVAELGTEIRANPGRNRGAFNDRRRCRGLFIDDVGSQRGSCGKRRDTEAGDGRESVFRVGFHFLYSFAARKQI